jgi:hypothetical protein
MVNLKERIFAVLSERGPMTDSELARTLHIRHQSINQAARQLASGGRTTRTDRGGRLTNGVDHASTARPRRFDEPKFAVIRQPKFITPPPPPPGSVALVACVEKKLDHPAPADELYTSTLFKRQREWATARCTMWFILSGKHGLLRPHDVIAPYQLALKKETVAKRRAWSLRVLEQLITELDALNGRYFEVYAGRDYYDYGLIGGILDAGATVVLPWDGLSFFERIARKEYESRG